MNIKQIKNHIIEEVYNKETLKNTLSVGDRCYMFQLSKSHIWFVSVLKYENFYKSENQFVWKNEYTQLSIKQNLIRKNSSLISYRTLMKLWDNYPHKHYMREKLPEDRSRIVFSIRDANDPMVCTGTFFENRIICSEFEYNDNNILIATPRFKQWDYYSNFYRYFKTSF